MWIMVSGPYTAGGASPELRAERLRDMNQAAVALQRAGHLPLIGVNLALPMIEAGGGFDELMMPVSLALAERCDACLRIGGASAGADEEAARFRAVGKPVYARLEDVPAPGTGCRLFPMLSVADLPASVAFYALLGGREKYRFPPAGQGEPAFVTLAFGETEIGLGKLGEPLHGQAQRPASGHRIELCVYVDDVDRVVAAVGRLVMAPADQPWGERVAYVEDPDGNLVMLAAPVA